MRIVELWDGFGVIWLGRVDVHESRMVQIRLVDGSMAAIANAKDRHICCENVS